MLCGLLNAYAFGTMGMIAGICAIAAFIADAVMLMLSGLGLMHARRFSPAAGILGGHPAVPPGRMSSVAIWKVAGIVAATGWSRGLKRPIRGHEEIETLPRPVRKAPGRLGYF